MSDAGAKFATPYEVVETSNPDLAVQPIVAVVEREGVERIVMGLPLNMNDTIGPAARQVVAWVKKLKACVNVPIVFVDERLSSFAAEQQLNDRKRAGEKLTRGKKKQQIDALAAAGFLQEFLDGKLVELKIPG